MDDTPKEQLTVTQTVVIEMTPPENGATTQVVS